MGFGSFIKKGLGGGIIGSIIGGGGGGGGAAGAGGALLSEAFFKDRDKRTGVTTSQEQITAANVFNKLTPDQQKDILINNPNIRTPLGGQTFDPLTNTLTLSESDFTQSQRLRQEGLAAGLSEQLGAALPSTDPSARFEEGRKLLEPQFQQDRERLEQQLADQGLPRGSEAFNKELNRLEQSQGSQLQSLAFSSVQTSEGQRAARFNEISSLLGQQQVGGVGFGQFQPQRSGLDLFGAEQAGLNRAFQAQQASKNRSANQRAALIGAAGQFGGAVAGAISDRNLKENIERVGESESGIPIYHFDYKNPNFGQFRYEGVMAQDLKEIAPDAIITLDDGIMAVNYSKIDVDFRRVD